MKSRLVAALAERAEVDRRIEEAEVAPEIALHPNLAASYRRNVENLTEALSAPEVEAGEARQALRNLVELITAEPRAEGRGLDLVVHGRLAQILHIANNRPDLSQGGRMFDLVAGARNSPKQQKAPEGADCMFEVVAGTDPALNLSDTSEGTVPPTEIRPGLDLLFNAYDITDARKPQKTSKSSGI